MIKLPMNTIDFYTVLPEDWFEQIGDFDTDAEKYAPIGYDFVTTSAYTGNSFFGGEITDLLVDEESKVFYIRSAIRQPIGDYGWETIWAWYSSEKNRYNEIARLIEMEGKV